MHLPPLGHLALVGAHCDDIAIGAGATVAALCRANPGLRVSSLVLTGAGTVREAEERSALAAFCPGASLDVTVEAFPDNRLPGHWLDAKAAVMGFRDRIVAAHDEPDLVIGPQPGDAHQDHRLIGDVLGQAFRRQPVWGYEILKYESDLPQVSTYVPVSEADVRAKSALLHEHYPSQRAHPWFDEAAFAGLMRVRGAQCNHPFAEAFVASKTIVTITGDED